MERELNAFGAFGILGVLILEQVLLVDAQVLLLLLIALSFIVREPCFDTLLVPLSSISPLFRIHLFVINRENLRAHLVDFQDRVQLDDPRLSILLVHHLEIEKRILLQFFLLLVELGHLIQRCSRFLLLVLGLTYEQILVIDVSIVPDKWYARVSFKDCGDLI